MTAESAPYGQEQWARVVRRSCGISDAVAEHDAREALVGFLEDQLQANGWQSPGREIAEAIAEALLALGTAQDVEDRLFLDELRSDAAMASREAAQRLIGKGVTIVDPEHLVLGMEDAYPPEVVAAAQQVLEALGQYLREQATGD